MLPIKCSDLWVVWPPTVSPPITILTVTQLRIPQLEYDHVSIARDMLDSVSSETLPHHHLTCTHTSVNLSSTASALTPFQTMRHSDLGGIEWFQLKLTT